MRNLATELRQIEALGLKRHRRVVQPALPASRGDRPLSFCSNDYLGLAADPRIVEALCDGARTWGAGAGASHLVSGHCEVHEQLEHRLAEFTGFPRALLFSSGYLANLAMVATLGNAGCEIFADRLNHASLNDALLLSRQRFRRYPHCDAAALEAMLSASSAKDKMVVTDAVFSMDGNIAPLDRLLESCERHDAWLVVDDAHGFGVLGKTGAGALEHFDLASARLVYMGTLGKAAGVAGAFIAADADVIELLIQQSRTYIYTTASPPALSAALLKSVELIAGEPWRRERLRALTARFAGSYRGRRWRLAQSSTAIQPVMVGSSDEAVAIAQSLASRGVLVPAIRPPTVPAGTARLRISLSAAHAESDIDALVAALDASETRA